MNDHSNGSAIAMATSTAMALARGGRRGVTAESITIEARTEAPALSAADEAMARYGAGEDAAFALVYDAVAPSLERYLVRHTRDQALAEDLLQQTFLKMHRHRGSFLPGSAVMPW